MNNLFRCVAVLALLLLPEVALAGPDKGNREAARAHYNIGNQHYERGEYDLAIAEFEIAHELSGAPGLLYNLGQAHRLRGDCATAKAYYQQYLREGDASAVQIRKNAAAFIRELGDCNAGAPVDLTAQGGLSSNPESGATPGSGIDDEGGGGDIWRLTGLAVGGAGLLSLGTGAYYAWRTRPLSDEVSEVCDSMMACEDENPPVWNEYQSARTRAVVFSVIGAAAIVGGGLMYFLAGDESEPRDRALAVLPTRGGGFVSLAGTF